MTKAVVLFSGGMDSTTAIAQAIFDGHQEILALTIGYGSLHNFAEGLAAKEVIAAYQKGWPMVTFVHEQYELPSAIFAGNSSALMGEIKMPEITYQEIQETEGPSPTVVPFRNANLISLATAVACAREYDAVYIGAHADDANNWAYPDCTPEFLGSMAAAVWVGSYHKVRLVFPFIWMQKHDIVMQADILGAPIELSWSCYNPYQILVGDDTMENVHCGRCPTCIERANAFAEANFWDPTDYMIPLINIIDPNHYQVNELNEWIPRSE